MDRSSFSPKTLAYMTAQGDASEILATAKIYNPPVPVELIKKIFMGDVTFDYVNFSDEYLGFTYPQYGMWHVLIKDDLPVTAKRFTAFHELFHILHNKPSYCRSTTEGSFEESKANHFASCVLMPAKWVKKYWNQNNDVEFLAKTFNVSRSAMEIRLKGLKHYLAA